MDTNKRTILAVILSGLILAGFGYASHYLGLSDKPAPAVVKTDEKSPENTPFHPQSKPADAVSPKVEEAPAAAPSPSVAISAPAVDGAIRLRGAVIDRLCLKDYARDLSKNSPRVCVLSVEKPEQATVARVGWRARAGEGVKVPGEDSLWHADATVLTPGAPVDLSWENGQGLTFKIRLSIDDHYMFAVEQSVSNADGRPVELQPYQEVVRNYTPEADGSFTAYEGPIGVLDGRLDDLSYKKVKDRADARGISEKRESSGGWMGITDKYWLAAFGAPQGTMVLGEFTFNNGSYAAMLNAPAQSLKGDATDAVKTYLFVGAKDYRLLEQYGRRLDIPDLDKSIDYGWFAFLTRPILKLLHRLYVWTGNFGLALLALTLIVKLVLFPLATKAAASQARMRLLAPKMKEIRERHAKDPTVMNKKIMETYRTEKVNPASGCLPVLIQAPIFFCLYKMLNISLDERHAPFFGWIKDLSVPDSTNVLNLFGLLPFDPSAFASFLHVSVWGLALGGTFWLVQKEAMVSVDPQQAKVMKWMPAFYVLFMSSFPAGLLIYYTWNNLLTYLQQVVIGRFTKLPVPTGDSPRETGKS